MRRIIVPAVFTLLLAATRRAEAQASRDSVLDGVLVGGAIAAVGGFLVAPYALCGGLGDTECVVIVRAAVGIPALAGETGVLVSRFICTSSEVSSPTV